MSRTRMLMAAGLFVLVAMFIASFRPSTSFGEVQLKQKELTWRQARLTHGEDLYAELCAVCHGQSGKGDGPAVVALKTAPPDLTLLASQNDGVFPHEELEQYLNGNKRIDAHGTVDMPIWGRAFEFTRPSWSRGQRKALARHRIHNIVGYIESLQAE